MKKALSLFLAILMIVSSFSSMVFADGGEAHSTSVVVSEAGDTLPFSINSAYIDSIYKSGENYIYEFMMIDATFDGEPINCSAKELRDIIMDKSDYRYGVDVYFEDRTLTESKKLNVSYFDYYEYQSHDFYTDAEVTVNKADAVSIYAETLVGSSKIPAMEIYFEDGNTTKIKNPEEYWDFEGKVPEKAGKYQIDIGAPLPLDLTLNDAPSISLGDYHIYDYFLEVGDSYGVCAQSGTYEYLRIFDNVGGTRRDNVTQNDICSILQEYFRDLDCSVSGFLFDDFDSFERELSGQGTFKIYVYQEWETYAVFEFHVNITVDKLDIDYITADDIEYYYLNSYNVAPTFHIHLKDGSVIDRLLPEMYYGIDGGWPNEKGSYVISGTVLGKYDFTLNATVTDEFPKVENTADIRILKAELDPIYIRYDEYEKKNVFDKYRIKFTYKVGENGEEQTGNMFDVSHLLQQYYLDYMFEVVIDDVDAVAGKSYPYRIEARNPNFHNACAFGDGFEFTVLDKTLAKSVEAMALTGDTEISGLRAFFDSAAYGDPVLGVYKLENPLPSEPGKYTVTLGNGVDVNVTVIKKPDLTIDKVTIDKELAEFAYEVCAADIVEAFAKLTFTLDGVQYKDKDLMFLNDTLWEYFGNSIYVQYVGLMSSAAYNGKLDVQYRIDISDRENLNLGTSFYLDYSGDIEDLGEFTLGLAPKTFTIGMPEDMSAAFILTDADGNVEYSTRRMYCGYVELPTEPGEYTLQVHLAGDTYIPWKVTIKELPKIDLKECLGLNNLTLDGIFAIEAYGERDYICENIELDYTLDEKTVHGTFDDFRENVYNSNIHITVDGKDYEVCSFSYGASYEYEPTDDYFYLDFSVQVVDLETYTPMMFSATEPLRVEITKTSCTGIDIMYFVPYPGEMFGCAVFLNFPDKPSLRISQSYVLPYLETIYDKPGKYTVDAGFPVKTEVTVLKRPDDLKISNTITIDEAILSTVTERYQLEWMLGQYGTVSCEFRGQKYTDVNMFELCELINKQLELDGELYHAEHYLSITSCNEDLSQFEAELWIDLIINGTDDSPNGSSYLTFDLTGNVAKTNIASITATPITLCEELFDTLYYGEGIYDLFKPVITYKNGETTTEIPYSMLYGVEIPEIKGPGKYEFTQKFAEGVECKFSITILENPTEGKWGDNITWKYDEKTKTVTFSGKGAMQQVEIDGSNPYSYMLNMPVCVLYDAEYVVIEDGIEELPDTLFAYFPPTKCIKLPNTLKKLPLIPSISYTEYSDDLYIPEGITKLVGVPIQYYIDMGEGTPTLVLPSTLTELDPMSLAFAVSDIIDRYSFDQDAKIKFNGTERQWKKIKLVDTEITPEMKKHLDWTANALEDIRNRAKEIFNDLRIEFEPEREIEVVGDTAKIDEKAFDVKGNEDIKINVAGNTDEEIKKVSIDSNTMSKISEAAGSEKSVEIALSDATVGFDPDAIAALAEKAGDKGVSISAESSGVEVLNKEQKEQLKNESVVAVIELNAFAGEEAIHDFGGGTVTVAVPFTLPDGADGEDFVVAYIADDGKVTLMPTKFIGGKLVFSTTHFSSYAVLDKSAPDYIKGDVNGDSELDISDAIYLLYHVYFKDLYPVNQECDFNGDSVVDISDAIYLLYHVYFKDIYILH